MKKFIAKAVIFLLTLFLVAFILQRLIDRGFKNSNLKDYKEWNDIIKSNINADLLIQGSSRALYHFSPFIIDSALNLNSYNLGVDGWRFHMQYYRFLLYLRYNKKPKYIIQNVDPYTLLKNPNMYHYTQFLPYLNIDVMRDAVSPFGLGWKDFYIPLYKYHGFISVPFQGLLSNFHKTTDNSGRYKGFKAQDKVWDSFAFNSYKKEMVNGSRIYADKETEDQFKSYLDLCKKKKIDVILVYSPEYFEAQKIVLYRDSIINIFRNFASSYNLPFLDYSNDSICLDTLNFYNSQHLNATGARKFNLKLVNDLKGLIK